MKRLAEALEAERPVAEAVHTDWEAKLLRSFAFLSLKPMLAVLNCSEKTMAQPEPQAVGSLPCLRLSAKIEEELARLAPDERAEFLADLNLSAPARNRLVRACFQRMGLVSFFTTDGDECRAWTVPSGTDAVTAAGQIHTDMARGFIRAEIISYDDLRACDGSMKAARAAGKVRLEGKTHEIRDGNVIHFRFNV